MEWYWVVLITLVTIWTVSVILAQFDEDYTIWWACGLLYPVLYFLFYPIRAINRYNGSRKYFEKHGITKVQYVFGKRPKER